MSTERRRTPRVALLGQVHGQIASLDVPIRVREMSLGGLSMETSIAFPVGALHDFSLTLGDGASVQLRGEVIYSKQMSTADGSALFITGVRFVGDESEEAAGAEQIIGRIS